MENTDIKLVSVNGERLQRLQKIMLSFEDAPFEKKKFMVLANEIRWFINKKFVNVEELNTTYKAMKKRQVTFLTTYRNKLISEGQRAQSIRENSSTN